MKPVTCGAEATLEHVINKMRDNRVHRVVVVNDEKKPIGIVSMSDLMKATLSSIRKPHIWEKKKE